MARATAAQQRATRAQAWYTALGTPAVAAAWHHYKNAAAGVAATLGLPRNACTAAVQAQAQAAGHANAAALAALGRAYNRACTRAYRAAGGPGRAPQVA